MFDKRSWRRALLLAPVGVFGFASLASADATLPPRKPGFWQTTMTMTLVINGKAMPMGGAPMVQAMCTDAATDAAALKRLATGGHACARFVIAGSGGVFTMDGNCIGPHGEAITSHGTITFESETAMHIVSDMSSPQMTGHMVGDSKWAGACPAGTVPGDEGMMRDGTFVKTRNINAPASPP